MKLISWNVNGIRACVRKGFGDFLEKERPCILGLQEIKINDKARAKETFDWPDYEEYWNSAQRPGYSGTAILMANDKCQMSNDLKVQSVSNGFGIEEFDVEGRAQTLEFPKFYFINLYFPNSNHELSRLAYKERFNKAFLKYAKKLEKKKPIIACGDFNAAHKEIDLKNPKTNTQNAGFTPEERAWMDRFTNAGLADTFRALHPNKIQYSWWSYRFGARRRNIGWRIDYFLVSKKLLKYVKKAFIMDKVEGSDHAPIGLVIDFD